MLSSNHNAERIMLTSSRSGKGFTLIEVLVAVTIFTIIMYGIVLLVSSLLSGSNRQSNLVWNADQARRVAFAIASELRNASIADTGAYSIAQADNQQLIFFSNIDATPDRERVRYYVAAGKLHKGVTKPSGSPLTYNPAQETKLVVQDNLANTSGQPVFYYYADSYNGTADTYLVQPVNINQIRFIKINLVVRNVGGTAGSGSYTVTAGATIRNLKTNLGN